LNLIVKKPFSGEKANRYRTSPLPCPYLPRESPGWEKVSIAQPAVYFRALFFMTLIDEEKKLFFSVLFVRKSIAKRKLKKFDLIVVLRVLKIDKSKLGRSVLDSGRSNYPFRRFYGMHFKFEKLR